MGNPLRYVDPSGFNEDDAFDVDFATSEADLSDPEFQTLINDLAGDFDPTTAVPPSLDPLATVSAPPLFDTNMCLKSAPSALAGTLFYLLAQLSLPPVPQGAPAVENVCRVRQCIWGDGSVTDAETYPLARGRMLRRVLDSLTGSPLSPGTWEAIRFAPQAGGSSNQELMQEIDRLDALDSIGEMLDEHRGAREKPREIGNESQPVSDPVSRPPHHEEPMRHDPIRPSLPIIKIPLGY
jgi:hypothetical protein